MPWVATDCCGWGFQTKQTTIEIHGICAESCDLEWLFFRSPPSTHSHSTINTTSGLPLVLAKLSRTRSSFNVPIHYILGNHCADANAKKSADGQTNMWLQANNHSHDHINCPTTQQFNKLLMDVAESQSMHRMDPGLANQIILFPALWHSEILKSRRMLPTVATGNRVQRICNEDMMRWHQLIADLGDNQPVSAWLRKLKWKNICASNFKKHGTTQLPLMQT